MPATGGYGNSGTPDFLVCLDGEFIGIECKAGQGKPTTLQLKHQSDIVAAGGRSFVIYESNIESLKQELNKHGKF